MSKRYIIPIFVPHLGCPKDCVFCNQRSISGQQKMITTEEIKNTIDFYLNSFSNKKAYKEIAFFGGSFTGIDPQKQEEYLQTAYEYVKQKKVNSIRVSTRPDYIDKTVLKRLKKYKVKIIELGVQSANDYILKKSNRGHTFGDVKKASKLIRRLGFTLGVQMMVGIPESTKIDEIKTAKELIKLKPKMVRIYPVLVIKNTKLAKDYENGIYTPLSLEQAVETSKELLSLFNKKNVEVIRIGLQNTNTITDPSDEKSEVLAGPYHPAFRQLVEASLWYDKIVSKIKKLDVKVKEVEITANPVDINNIVGHHKQNTKNLKDFYNVTLKLKQNNSIRPNHFKLKVTKIYEDFKK